MIENEIESKIENTVFDDLVNEMVDNRKKLSEILDKVTSFRNNIERLIPNSNEYKNRFIMEQKIKTVTEIIKSELEIRKQIDNSIKTEFDLRSKVKESDKESDGDISKIISLLEGANFLENNENESLDDIEEDQEENEIKFDEINELEIQQIDDNDNNVISLQKEQQ